MQPPDLRPVWAKDPLVRPFVFTRPGAPPWRSARPHPWFPAAPLTKDFFKLDELPFVEMILKLDAASYAANEMAMPRWVFYDCGLLPGLVAGYALHRSVASAAIGKILDAPADAEWLPISLFIMIPDRTPGAWVAHNLCSVNVALAPAAGYHGLAFLTKAFGLWISDAAVLSGVTQWTSPALRLHAAFGTPEVRTAFTPIHSHPATLTYRMDLDPAGWGRFFGEKTAAPTLGLGPAGFDVDPKSTESLKSFQRRLEENDARYYLNADQMSNRAPHDALTVYKRESKEGY